MNSPLRMVLLQTEARVEFEAELKPEQRVDEVQLLPKLKANILDTFSVLSFTNMNRFFSFFILIHIETLTSDRNVDRLQTYLANKLFLSGLVFCFYSFSFATGLEPISENLTVSKTVGIIYSSMS